MTIKEAARYINDYEGEARDAFNEYKEGLHRTAQFVIQQDVEWGLHLLEELVRLKGWENDYWGTLLNGFREANLSEEQWASLLYILDEIEPAFNSCLHSIADLLLEGVRRTDVGIIPNHLLEHADRIATKVYRLSMPETEDEGVKINGVFDWTTTTINRPSGRTVEFWTHYLNKVLAAKEPKIPHIPEEFKAKFEGVLLSPGFPGLLGIPIMTQRLWWFYALDKEWTKTWLLPLLEWHDNDPKMLAAWDGYFYSRRWTQGMLEDMLPYYEQAFSHTAILQSGRGHERFTDDIVSIAFYGGFDPLIDREGWLQRFLHNSDEATRGAWAEGVTRTLENMRPEVKAEQWKRWIKRYWEMRLEGTPDPLTEKEESQMMEWAFHLQPVFDEAVELVARLGNPKSSDHSIYYDLTTREQIGNYPAVSLAKYLSYILRWQEPPFWSCKEMGTIFEHLVAGYALPADLRDICNSLSRLGCENALKLSESIPRA